MSTTPKLVNAGRVYIHNPCTVHTLHSLRISACNLCLRPTDHNFIEKLLRDWKLFHKFNTSAKASTKEPCVSSTTLSLHPHVYSFTASLETHCTSFETYRILAENTSCKTRSSKNTFVLRAKLSWPDSCSYHVAVAYRKMFIIPSNCWLIFIRSHARWC